MMINKTKPTVVITTLVLTFILVTTTFSRATRPEPNPTDSKPNPRPNNHHHRDQGGPSGGGQDNGPGFFPPGAGFGIPGFDNNWGQGIFGGGSGGYGYGFGGPKGGYSKGGIIRSSVVCKDKGPCYMKKLTCPAKCFSSFSKSGKGFGAGGGGGGCTMDCKKKCVAFC